MTYYESAEGLLLTKERAIEEVIAHGCSPCEFLAEMGEEEQYSATEVLEWLGY